MSFFFSKEARMQRQEEKKLEQQKELQLKEQREKEAEERKKLEEQRVNQYCEWYSSEIEKFQAELRSKNFTPSWGFEVEQEIDFQQGIGGIQEDNKFFFDFSPMEGLAFDTVSKQMLYFNFPTGHYSKYKSGNTTLNITYVLIPFSKIFSANVEINSETTISTVTSKQNVISRSIIGGLLAGEAGAIIGGTTGKDISVSKTDIAPKKIVFNIQTVHDEYPILSFEFKESALITFYSATNKYIADAMYSTFSKDKKHAKFWRQGTKRNCNTNTDYIYVRHYCSEGYSRTNKIENVLESIKTYIMKIEAIIQQCNLDSQATNATPTVDIVAEIKKLADLKEQGIITEEEFVKLKAKYF